jgi:hypothetical protein
LAEEAFRLAAEDLESHQSRLQHDDLKVTFLRGRNQVYESLVRLALDHGESPVDTAYSWCERAKSSGLDELLSHHLPSVQLRGEQSLLRRVHRLRDELNLQYVKARPETGSTLAHADFEAVVLKEQELARTLREVAADDPEFVSLQQVTPANLVEVQAFLPDESTLVEYFMTQEEVIAFVVTRDDAKVFRHLAPPGRVKVCRSDWLSSASRSSFWAGLRASPLPAILDGTNQILEEALHAALINLGSRTENHSAHDRSARNAPFSAVSGVLRR